ncbi:eukaryotic translation initiation factor 3 subunit I-like protein [Dinothrombium tinctorium]|uniref:Eukaryotic translation initiation factor 3 subunit I n=1 Tax=Dinothrombium tinctorium TaxID=1965070 RepID=A0A443RLX6_9ACAR|nr:eukaryotic translation initiation factor 3 subunit I-like protein [Dinothrombium tinctorium]
MRPIVLHGHERPITKIRYNKDGDLLFSASKDNIPNVWYSINGERLGTFDGHSGAIWSIDCNWDSTKVVTGGADNSLRLWDLQTGKEIANIVTNSPVRTVTFSYSGKLVFYTTDSVMKFPSELIVFDTTIGEHLTGNDHVARFPSGAQKPTAALWGELDRSLITGHVNGQITKWDLRKPHDKLNVVEEHKKQINDMQYNVDQTMFITASMDNTAKLFDANSLELLKVYKTERPVNSAAISPIRDHVVLGGGQEAMQVTTTSAREGKFEARFFHLVFEEEFARVKGHFGPINSVAFHPDGKSYSSGGEDGLVRIQTFDPPYYEFKFEY